MMSERKGVIRFTRKAWAKLMYVRDKADQQEVSALGILGDVSRPGTVTDVAVVKQENTGSTTDFDTEALAAWQGAQVEAGLQPWQTMRVWIHTHPFCSQGKPTPSSTDWATMKEALGTPDWAVMLVVAESDEMGQAYACLRVNKGFGADSLLDVIPAEEGEFEGLHEEWDREYKANVAERRIVHEEVVGGEWTPDGDGGYERRGHGGYQSFRQPGVTSVIRPGGHLEKRDEQRREAAVREALGKGVMVSRDVWALLGKALADHRLVNYEWVQLVQVGIQLIDDEGMRLEALAAMGRKKGEWKAAVKRRQKLLLTLGDERALEAAEDDQDMQELREALREAGEGRSVSVDEEGRTTVLYKNGQKEVIDDTAD